MPRNLDLSALRSFVAIVESGGVTKAARLLHLTQSAVSMQVKRLEESLDVALLTRVGRGVEPTRDGEELAALSRRLIALNDEIVERMTAPRWAGELTLGVPHDIVYPQTPWVLRRFAEEHPGVVVRLASDPSATLMEMIADGRCDVIVTTEAGLGAGGETMSRRRLRWVGAPDGRAWRRRPLKIAFEKLCAFRQPVFAALDEAGFDWEWTIDTANFDAATATIAADLAVSAMLEGSSPPALVEIDHGGALPELRAFNVNLYLTRGPNAELAQRLASIVRVAYGEGAGGQQAA